MKLFIGGISFKTTNEDLEKYLSEVAEVSNVNIIMDKFDNTRSRGFGFAEFANDEDAKKVIKELDGKEFMGRNLAINEANEKPRNNDRNDRGDRGSFRKRSF